MLKIGVSTHNTHTQRRKKWVIKIKADMNYVVIC